MNTYGNQDKRNNAGFGAEDWGFMTISVIIPAYNPELSWLLETLNSIVNQSFQVTEVIIVDDGSKTLIADVLEELNIFNETKIILRVIRNAKNLGIAKSLDIGIRSCQSDFIFRVDADDIWYKSHVESVMIEFSKSDDVGFVHTHADYIIDGDFVPYFSKSYLLSVFGIFWDNPVVHSSACFRRSVYLSSIGYDNGFKWEDYRLWCDFYFLCRATIICRPTLMYRIHSRSLSRIDKREAILNRMNIQLILMKKLYNNGRFLKAFIVMIFCLIQWIRVKNSESKK